jgi:hypothetical protein
MLRIVKALCEDAGHELAYLDGQTPGAARQGIVDAFNAPGSRAFVFLVSTHAGGEFQVHFRSSCALYRPVEAEDVLESRTRPTDEPLTNYRPLPKIKSQASG